MTEYDATRDRIDAAERVVLGTLMMHPAAVPDVAGRLDRAAFYDTRNGAVFSAIVALHQAGRPTAPAAVADRLDAATLERVGGVSVLLDMVHEADAPGAVGYYVSIVADQDRRRRFVAATVRLQQTVERPDQDPAAIAGAVDALIELTREQAGELGDAHRPRYGDVAALVAGALPGPAQPTILHRTDGAALLYRGKVNVLFGDSESGKTWLALAAITEQLTAGGKAAFIDLDHNGMTEIVNRLISLGAKPADLADPDRFRYCEPEDATELDYFLNDLSAWRPEVAALDSLGEILPMLGLSSNLPDDYTTGHRKALLPLARVGAAVIAIDHLPKDDAARAKGPTGTLAKQRAVNGVTLRVDVVDAFAPGHGGSASLAVFKDRGGGLRGVCPPGKRPAAGRFVMQDNGVAGLAWYITAPTGPPTRVNAGVPDADLAELDGLDPPARSVREVKERLNWGTNRAAAAMSRWRELRKCLPEGKAA